MEVLKGVWMTARDILPISISLLIFQIFVLKSPIDDLRSVILGIMLSFFGLYIFVQGLKLGLIPLGNAVGAGLPALDNVYLIVAFNFLLSYASTIAEPAVTALAMEVEEVSVGAIPNKVLKHTIAIGAGVGMGLGTVKILFSIPNSKVILPVVAVIMVLGYFAPESITGVAFDAAGVTTGPVNVPLNMAIGLGLSSAIENSDPLIDGFGMIALAILCTIIAVLVVGIIADI
ncbi:DUF1538 domain-containing protein [Xylanivirga thermophila]|jgi:hypothetical protein|uniref:DUF1538 domain-containing protein n=1 Tax=Xylanivirga thermophila TaxID=2496273 RepID=UPI001FB3114A|nr:DUF1538 domain-containing protein [Xylanivirga thermophila]